MQLTYPIILMAGDGDPVPMFIMMAIMFVAMYFFLIRPQQKKQKKQQLFIDDLKKGDKVVTAGGIHGKIAKVDETSLLIEVDTNTKLRIEKSVISLEMTQQEQGEKKE